MNEDNLKNQISTEPKIKGYKAFNADMTCRNFQYEVGKEYTETSDIILCKRGFHFCATIMDCFRYYKFDPKLTKVALIEAKGEVVKTGIKSVTNKIYIERLLSWNEVLNVCNLGDGNLGYRNSGDGNLGYRNSGDRNSGNWNSGDRNSGDRNSGNRNSGDRNSGDRNSGNRNSGDRNSGNKNSGNWNSGNWNSGNNNSGDRNSGNWNSGGGNSGNKNSGYQNSGDGNSGYGNSGQFNSCNFESGFFNTKISDTIRIFNKEISIGRETLYNTPGFKLLNYFKLYKYKDIKGKTRHYSYKQSWAMFLYDVLHNKKIKERLKIIQDIKNIPGFDSEIFFDLTGLKL